MKYAKKPELIDAMQWDGTLAGIEKIEAAFVESCPGNCKCFNGCKAESRIETARMVRTGNVVREWKIQTEYGIKTVEKGQYIVDDGRVMIMEGEDFEEYFFPVMDLNNIGAAVFEIANDGALDSELSSIISRGIDELLKGLKK